MVEKLKNCPFCGGQVVSTSGNDWVASSVECAHCDLTFCAGSNHAEVITAWNTRASLREQPTEIVFKPNVPVFMDDEQPTEAGDGLAGELRELRAFLDGTGPLDGAHFGEKRGSGAFWWRRYLDVIDQAASLTRPLEDEAVERVVLHERLSDAFAKCWGNHSREWPGSNRLADIALAALRPEQDSANGTADPSRQDERVVIIEECARIADERADAYRGITTPHVLNAARLGEAERIAAAIRALAAKEPGK